MIEPGDLVLVTGANGFVGSHLVEALLRRGYRVRCMVRRTSDLRFIQDLPVEWAYADVSDESALPDACQGVDAVCHCAALTRAPDAETFFRVNTRGAEALARAALETCPTLDRFLFLSSQAAAGPSAGARDVLDEDSTPHAITWYGESKWAAEQSLAALEVGGQKLPLTVVRAAPVFGPRDRDFFTYFQLVQHRLSLRPGAGEHYVSLIYVDDLVDLLLLALEADRAAGQTYFASGGNYSHTELARAIAGALDRPLVTIHVPAAGLRLLGAWSRLQYRLTGRVPLLNDQRVLDLLEPYWLCSAEKAASDLGFAPRHSLVAAVHDTADWYREQGWL